VTGTPSRGPIEEPSDPTIRTSEGLLRGPLSAYLDSGIRIGVETILRAPEPHFWKKAATRAPVW